MILSKFVLGEYAFYGEKLQPYGLLGFLIFNLGFFIYLRNEKGDLGIFKGFCTCKSHEDFFYQILNILYQFVLEKLDFASNKFFWASFFK